MASERAYFQGVILLIKAVIFDFDGTVADTLPICYYAFQQVFLEYDGRDLTPTQIREMFGPPEAEILERRLANQSDIDGAIHDYYRHYEDKHTTYTTLSEPMRRLLVDLREAGFKTGIFTGKGRRSLDISLQKLSLNGLFDVMVAGDDVAKPKPDPEGLHWILAHLGIRPDEVVFLGDSDVDVEAGKRAGVHTVGVQWLPEYVAEVFHSKPDFVFREIDDCRRFLNLNG